MAVQLARPLRVLVVDDDEGVANMVSRALAHESYDVRTEASGERGLHTAREWHPDVVVLDVMLPGANGFAICRQLRTEQPGVGVLMLTARTELTAEIVGLDAGADDYLVKPFSLPALAAHLRAVLRRREPAPETLSYADLELCTASRRARRGDRDIALTTTEYKLLLQLMRSAGQVVAKTVLTERIWGLDCEGKDIENVLEVYIRYLRKKLEADGESRLIHTLRGSGYVLRTD